MVVVAIDCDWCNRGSSHVYSREINLVGDAMSLIDTTELEAALATTNANVGRAIAVSAQNAADIADMESLPHNGLVDVTQCGVKGDGVTNDTAAIQRLFDTAKRTLYFPSGRYRVTKTLTLRPRYGFRVLGGGITADVKRFWGNNSELAWDGPKGQPVVKFHTFGLVWDGLNIDGSGKASSGLLVDKKDGDPKIPTGKSYIPTMSIRNCDAGVQIGGSLKVHNCDWMCFGFLNLENCKVGYLLNNYMGIMNHITFLRPYKVHTIVQVNGGGNMNVENLGVVWGTKRILYFGHPGGSSNTASFRFNNVKQDNHLNDVVWFSQKANDSGSVLFENSHLANDKLKPSMFRVQGYVDLTLRRVWGLPKGAVDAKMIKSPNGKTWHPNVLVDRCKCASTVKSPKDLWGKVSGKCYLKTRDLLRLNGEPIE